jgi:hypothetical protein
MITKKTRRHNGWKIPDLTIKEKKSNIINDGLDPQAYWDNWREYRDGYRNIGDDRSKLLKKRKIKYAYNKDKAIKTYHKIRKHIKIRRVRKT